MSYLVRKGSQNTVNPWSAMDQMMDHFFRSSWPFAPATLEPFAKEPAMDMYRQDGKICLDIELPGLKVQDIRLKAYKDRLELSAEKSGQSEDKDRQRVVSERYYGSLTRTIALPEEVDPASLTAQFRDGVLHLEAKTAAPSNDGRDVTIQS